jgi:hypothetical protein
VPVAHRSTLRLDRIRLAGTTACCALLAACTLTIAQPVQPQAGQAQQQAPSKSAPPSLAGPDPAKGGAAWLRIAAPGKDELWYDREMLVFSGGEITFWRRVNFAIPQQFKGFQVSTALYREQINCDDHTMRVLSQVLQSADGMVVDRVNHLSPESIPIVPETVGDALRRTLCPLVAQRRMADERLRLAQERLDNRRRELDRLRAEVEELEASVARLRAESPRDPASDAARESSRDATRDAPRDAPRQPGRQGP